ncbi:hypothetical protein [Rhizobium sp. BG4]|uniref:hypothetical protein n=1 Tax=Rhizobium sp. BG4 TaxID=2613770 RepID=UPI00193DF66E|nr:hypothetical protein [Rhizobium sp. BG4]QRM46230.1 hypothetical protein F2982_22790 [Rhizobium sp. BG4]
MMGLHYNSSAARALEPDVVRHDRLAMAALDPFDPVFSEALQRLAQAFVATHQAEPRIAALFATEQRWLLCHAALGAHFRTGGIGRGLTRPVLVEMSDRYAIASRNTVHAFIDEALKYDFVRLVTLRRPGGHHRFVPSPKVIGMLAHWYGLHFEALDVIDGGSRASLFRADADNLLLQMQPDVADGLLAAPGIRNSGLLYATFSRVDAGGLIMDRLFGGIDLTIPATFDRYETDITSISSLASFAGLSRAHVSRKLSAAEAAGGAGWSGLRGRSPLWISHDFRRQYAQAQATKLSILDDAFSRALAARTEAS